MQKGSKHHPYPGATDKKAGVSAVLLSEKFLFLMKCSFLLIAMQLTFAGTVLPAHKAAAQDLTQKISIQLKDASLKEALTAIEKQSTIQFNVQSALLKNSTKKVMLSASKISVQEAIASILANTNLRYRLVEGYVVIDAKPVPPKPGRISGRILDDRGEPLPGASVKVIETFSGIQTGADGSFTLNLPPGTYTLEISYISFQTQRITGVVVTEDKNTPFNIVLKPNAKGLKEVVVTSGYKKASVEGLLIRQKNAAEVSNGISAEQIARTPDKNIGESLKRISGVSSVDNKFVLIRGIGERYNSAMLDGTVLPSTEAQSRNFSFDLIPSNMVDNVVVSKTATPDMNASFGGGLIQINTKDIPNENFMSFTAGTSFNDQSTGKEFLSRKRGKYDYLGFDDGRRNFPKDLVITDGANREVIDAQSKKFINDNFTVYQEKTAPSQNYQFSIGQLFRLDTANNNKFGLTGSLSYRNTQNINIIDKQNRTTWFEESTNNTGKAYGFNTTFGGLLNAGLQLGKNRFSFRNTYTRMFDNTFVRTIGYSDDVPGGVAGVDLPPSRIQEVGDPAFTDLLQNKLSGQHQLGKVKIEWDAATASIKREEKDLAIAESKPVLIGDEYQYFHYTGTNTEPRITPTSRHNYQNKEQHYSWNLSATIPFNIGNIRSSVKTGYFGNRKKASFDWQIAALTAAPSIPDSLRYLPIGGMIKPEHMGINGFQYTVTSLYLDAYEGKSNNHAGYLMFDNRLMEKIRLVWGIRGEYYKYTEIKNGNNYTIDVWNLKPDPHWQWLPSANLTYSPTNQVNVRAAYSSSVVRPELMDNSQFWRYSPYLSAQYGNQGLYSTRINSWDLKTEWFPGLGEIISIGGFYKKFDNPAELIVSTTTGGNPEYYLKSADWAKVYGLEFELRKNFGLLFDNKTLNDLTAYANVTLQKSEVRSTYQVANPTPGEPDIDAPSKQTRPMYGQTPYLINLGLQYNGEFLGLNLAYNKSGYKTYIVGVLPNEGEFEKPRQQLDAQISYRLFKKKLEIKLNAGNLLNAASTFYSNTGSYEDNPDHENITTDFSNALRLKPGFTDKYEEGDRVTFSQRFGRTFSTSLTWNF